MRTTMNFINKDTKDRNVTSMTNGADGELMSVFRTKRRYHYMDRLVLVYDEETGHLRVGQGPKTEMESVSGVRVINSVSELPINGKMDTLYVCLNNNSMYVWNADAKTWLPIGGSSGGGDSQSSTQSSVLVFNNREGFPSVGAVNTLYVTKQGESYIYDPANNTYIQLGNNSVDAYTKQESDDRYAKKCLEVRDTFSVDSSNPTVNFQLTKLPVGEINLYINGIHYVNTEAEENYTYDSASKTLTWINTDEDSGGFTLEDAVICIEYESAERDNKPAW